MATLYYVARARYVENVTYTFIDNFYDEIVPFEKRGSADCCGVIVFFCLASIVFSASLALFLLV